MFTAPFPSAHRDAVLASFPSDKNSLVLQYLCYLISNRSVLYYYKDICQKMNDSSWIIDFGHGVGPIRLGIKIADFVNKTIAEDFPRAKINITSAPAAELFTIGTTIDLLDFGILCHFHSKSEKLFMIICYDLTKLNFNLKGLLFGDGVSKSAEPSLEMVHKALGPSFPGKFISNSTDPNLASTYPYLLSLNGVSLLFVTSKKKEQICLLSKVSCP